MATHSNTLAWKIPWTEEPGSLQSMGSQRGGRRESDTTERRHFHFPHLLLFSVYKRNWHSDSDKMIRRGTSLPSSRMPSFPNKVVFLASKKKKKKNSMILFTTSIPVISIQMFNTHYLVSFMIKLKMSKIFALHPVLSAGLIVDTDSLF